MKISYSRKNISLSIMEDEILSENCHTKYLLLRRWILSQQTFVGYEDVLKMSSKHVLKTSSTRLQRNNFSSFKTKNFFIFRSSFSSTSNVCFQIGRCVATTWQWSFHLISKTTQDWKDMWIPSPNLASLRQTNWFYWFVKTENNIMWELVARQSSAKKLS